MAGDGDSNRMSELCVLQWSVAPDIVLSLFFFAWEKMALNRFFALVLLLLGIAFSFSFSQLTAHSPTCTKCCVLVCVCVDARAAMRQR